MNFYIIFLTVTSLKRADHWAVEQTAVDFIMISNEQSSDVSDVGSNFVEIKLDKEPEDSKVDNTAKCSRMSVFCRKCCLCLDSIKTSKNPLPENPSICQRIRYAFLCPPHGIIGFYITAIFLFAILYGCLWSLFRDYALPCNIIFQLWFHFITSLIGGYVIHLISLPPLLGKY